MTDMKEETKFLALRYAGIAQKDWGRYAAQMDEISCFLEKNVHPLSLYKVSALEKRPGGIYVKEADLVLEGKSAGKMLEEAELGVMMLATLTHRFDFLLSALQKTDMAAAVFLDALGSAWLEEILDDLQKNIQEQYPGMYLSDRFSCGYGDLPLALQPELLACLQKEKSLGVQVLPSCMMQPSKSVSALAGISCRPLPARIRGCAFCAMAGNCRYRKEGKYCEHF